MVLISSTIHPVVVFAHAASKSELGVDGAAGTVLVGVSVERIVEVDEGDEELAAEVDWSEVDARDADDVFVVVVEGLAVMVVEEGATEGVAEGAVEVGEAAAVTVTVVAGGDAGFVGPEHAVADISATAVKAMPPREQWRAVRPKVVECAQLPFVNPVTWRGAYVSSRPQWPLRDGGCRPRKLIEADQMPRIPKDGRAPVTIAGWSRRSGGWTLTTSSVAGCWRSSTSSRTKPRSMSRA